MDSKEHRTWINSLRAQVREQYVNRGMLGVFAAKTGIAEGRLRNWVNGSVDDPDYMELQKMHMVLCETSQLPFPDEETSIDLGSLSKLVNLLMAQHKTRTFADLVYSTTVQAGLLAGLQLHRVDGSKSLREIHGETQTIIADLFIGSAIMASRIGVEPGNIIKQRFEELRSMANGTAAEGPTTKADYSSGTGVQQCNSQEQYNTMEQITEKLSAP